MRALDPESDYIVVRSAKSGFVHEHVFLKDLDKLLEGIGDSARPIQAQDAVGPASTSQEAVSVLTDALLGLKQENDQLKARLANLEAIVSVHAENFEVFKSLVRG